MSIFGPPASVGLCRRQRLYQITAQIGLVDGAIVERFDCYVETPAKANVSKDLYVIGVNVFVRKAGPIRHHGPN
jgi:hypothetical protein